MINKQYRKKTLKGSFLTRQYREGLTLRIIKRRQRHLLSEQRQPLIIEDGLHHRKLLGFKEEQRFT
jgi:hypothetical protein